MCSYAGKRSFSFYFIRFIVYNNGYILMRAQHFVPYFTFSFTRVCTTRSYFHLSLSTHLPQVYVSMREQCFFHYFTFSFTRVWPTNNKLFFLYLFRLILYDNGYVSMRERHVFLYCTLCSMRVFTKITRFSPIFFDLSSKTMHVYASMREQYVFHESNESSLIERYLLCVYSQ